MVKTEKICYAKPVKRAKRVDPMGVAILALCGTQYGDKTSGLGRKIVESLISSKTPYITQLFGEYI